MNGFKTTLAAAIALATAFILSCSSDDGGIASQIQEALPSSSSESGDDPSSSSPEEASSQSAEGEGEHISSSSLEGAGESSSGLQSEASSSSQESEGVSSSSSRQPTELEAYCAENLCALDERDGQLYRYRKVSYPVGDGEGEEKTLYAMMDNLNYSRSETLGYCYWVDMKSDNPHENGIGCDNGYGRVYEWETAMDGNESQGLCPDGWRLPTFGEVSEGLSMLTNSIYYKKTEEYDPYEDEWIVTEEYNYEYGHWWSGKGGNAILAGNYNRNVDWPPIGWKERDSYGYWWTSSGNNYFILGTDAYVNTGSSASELDRFSVSCVKD